MELFFTETFSPGEAKFSLSVEESIHVGKVLRKKTADNIQLTDGRGNLVHAVIKGEKNRQLNLMVKEYKTLPYPTENDIELAISVIRPARMDWAIEKATELGIRKIVPLICQYTTYRRLKLDHLNRIAISAIKQSGQVYLPEISAPVTISEWIKLSGQTESNRFIAIPDKGGIWAGQKRSRETRKYLLLIGPEGGFHRDELELSRQYHFQPLHLGPTVLRTETAAIAAITVLKSRML